MLLATLAKVLPRERWAILVSLSTLLRWSHRQLVPRCWTCLRTGGGGFSQTCLVTAETLNLHPTRLRAGTAHG
jgi:hypothetical protein